MKIDVKEFDCLTWLVSYYDYNANKIEYYNVLKYREDFIKKFKKNCDTKEEFAEKMRREMMYCYWSKCEWELVIEIDDNDRIWLNPWVGCRNPEDVRIDVTDREDFDWRGFAELHINKQIYKNMAKIDVFNQLEWRWTEFVDYCWYMNPNENESETTPIKIEHTFEDWYELVEIEDERF